MRNFNTNQARHLYVASAKKDSIAGVTSNGDLYVGSDASGNMFFVYKNADGNITRSDTIPVAGIEYYNKKAAAALAKPLIAHTVAVDTTAVTLASLVGKTVRLTIYVRGFIGLDANDVIPVNVELVGNSTNTANATAFHKALAIAIAKAMPKKDVPYFRVFSNGSEVTADTAESSVTGAAAGVVVVATQQKWVRGKLDGTPFELTFQFNYQPDNSTDIAWGTATAAASAISGYATISGDYELADLEYFALGERGDIYRGSEWPNDIVPTYMINPAAGTGYSVITIQYAYQGKAENIQKSPRTIQIAAGSSVANAIFSAIEAVIAGSGSGSGSGA